MTNTELRYYCIPFWEYFRKAFREESDWESRPIRGKWARIEIWKSCNKAIFCLYAVNDINREGIVIYDDKDITDEPIERALSSSDSWYTVKSLDKSFWENPDKDLAGALKEMGRA